MLFVFSEGWYNPIFFLGDVSSYLNQQLYLRSNWYLSVTTHIIMK